MGPVQGWALVGTTRRGVFGGGAVTALELLSRLWGFGRGSIRFSKVLLEVSGVGAPAGPAGSRMPGGSVGPLGPSKSLRKRHSRARSLLLFDLFFTRLPKSQPVFATIFLKNFLRSFL